MSRLYTLQFFVADSDNCIIPLPLLSENALEQVRNPFGHWTPMAQKIVQIAQGTGRFVPYEADDKTKRCAEPIQILFVEMGHLCSHDFFYNFSGGTAYRDYCQQQHSRVILRATEPIPGSKQGFGKPQNDLYPIITVGLLDVMSIYEEAPNLDFETAAETQDWQEARKTNNWLYSLGLDHRVKFLDSSIWHRYVPYEKHFTLNFGRILQKIITYYDLRLYHSLASLATLEFQCRMLQNSSIAAYGVNGHHEAVTPFKFHSETVMERKGKQFIRFFRRETRNKHLSALPWNVLLIDDYANSPISTSDESGEKSKKDIIELWLKEPEPKVKGQTKIKIHIHSFTDSAAKVISHAVKLLSKPHDLIMLDYLLGDGELHPNLNLKAYGHELLLELASTQRNTNLKRGPSGRFWVFPISSFPFAFTDKLRQLNLDGSNERWHIANGGDPISTPEFFRLNFYRLLLKQINEYYLHEAALGRWVERFNTIDDKDLWCKAVYRQVSLEKTKTEVLNNNLDSSSFSNALYKLIRAEERVCPFWENLNQWVFLLMDYQKGQPYQHLEDALMAVGNGRQRYTSLLEKIHVKIQPFLFDAEKSMVKYAQFLKNQPNFDQKLSFKEMKSRENIEDDTSLYHFPEEIIALLPDLKELDLSGTNLSKIPPEISNFTKLETLILSHNPALHYLPVKKLQDLPHLYRIDLRHTTTITLKTLTHDNLAHGFDQVQRLLQGLLPIMEKMAVASESVNPKKVFVMYSSKDHHYRDLLDVHCQQLIRNGKIEIWYDRKVLPGENWNNEILTKLQQAEIILLLISPDFMASDYIWDNEIPLAMKRDKEKMAEVIPIYIRKADVEDAPFLQLQGLPSGPDNPVSKNNVDDAFFEIVKGIKKRIGP